MTYDILSMPQRRHYSKDLKDRVVYQYCEMDYTTTEIAKNLNMSLRVVQRTLCIWKEIGETIKDPKAYARQGRSWTMDTGSIEVCISHKLWCY